MKKLLCILGAVALMSGVVAAIVWACCGQVTWPIEIIVDDEIVLPCGFQGTVQIPFSVVIDGYEEWTMENDTYVSTTAGGNWTLQEAGTYDLGVAVLPAGFDPIDVTITATATRGDTGETVTETATVTIVWEPCEVPVDIKGGSCPNSVNTKSKGVLPVAILEGGEVALADIDPDSIKVEGVPVIAGMSIMEDSTQAGPLVGAPEDCLECFDADANLNCDTDGDGIDDAYCGDGVDELVVYVDMEALAAGPLADAERGDCTPLEVTGMTYDGRAIVGSDSVSIVK